MIFRKYDIRGMFGEDLDEQTAEPFKKAKEAGATVIEINPGESAYFGVADIRLQGKTGEILPRVIEKIRNA